MGTLIITILELVIALILLRIFTGKEALVPKTSSGVIRLVVGFLCALGVLLIMSHCLGKYGRLCHEELIAGTFFALVLLGLILIPLGAIQTVWCVKKRPSGENGDAGN
jgi:hypothetical protein